ncbi:hypothetical protein PsorP6_002162 [Peronosclerospora sorghi]|uniref:Uncharacterized protein n=1 Tax=Peronosclerospora sorghi TaxID=230839 RepID=A0ACC0WUX5_9STRA|nr:hypothetical protein PsorP6_002162 [Peronosclerospora sorghi]
MQIQQQRQQQYANQMMMNHQMVSCCSLPASHTSSKCTQVKFPQPLVVVRQQVLLEHLWEVSQRPPTSSYEEEFARVNAMKMQNSDFIPPPMEVLRISMIQSAASQQNMAMGGNAYI